MNSGKEICMVPVEVALVNRVKECRQCQWFWGGVVPYGPFPAYDWEEEFPEAIKNGPPQSEGREPIKWTNVTQVGEKSVEPAILKGCRKAPIMTIGINPNMTAFFAGTKSTTWAYPYFSREQTYAYYYRHATIYQESFDKERLREYIIKGTEIFAEEDGSVQIERSKSHRWMHFTFTYKDRSEPVHVEQAWLPEERLVVFNEPPKGDSLMAIPIRKNTLIAAKIRLDAGVSADIFANKTDYYERLQPALASFNEYLKRNGFSHSELTMGEDVSMHDMVGCASPGWSNNYDIPQDVIANNCVNTNRYMLDQLLQSKPKVVFIVSTSSLEMFANGFRKVGGVINLDFAERDIFDLLKETCQQRRTIEWRDGESTFTARMIATPHFSYGTNFTQQSRLSVKAWEVFSLQYPKDAQCIIDNKRLLTRDGDNYVSVLVTQDDEELKKQLNPNAWALLMDYHYNPYQLISDALIEEQEAKGLISDASAKHLDRAPGSCAFCVNDRWSFPEGCDYGLV